MKIWFVIKCEYSQHKIFWALNHIEENEEILEESNVYKNESIKGERVLEVSQYKTNLILLLTVVCRKL